MILSCNIVPVSLNLPDGPTLSLDIDQPAANPAALAMAILNSAKSRCRASSNPQVPLVIISQPLPGPVAGQSGPAPQVWPERPDQSAGNADAGAAAAPPAATSHSDIQTEVVVEMIQISIDPNESAGDGAQSSTDMASLPVANDQPTSEATASNVTPTPAGEEAAAVVSVSLNIRAIVRTSCR